MIKVMISAGEASGDLHGASVARALKRLDPSVEIFGMGGQSMREAGVEIVQDIADLGVIGFVEVIRNLPRLFRLRDFLIRLMDERQPDVIVLIDYPDFHMRLAPHAKERRIPVISYIAPSAWAWRKGRAKSTAKMVDHIAAIFPFEAKVYEEAGASVTFVGHPLLDIVQPSMDKEAAYSFFSADRQKPIVLLLPGSRKNEINRLLPVMLAGAQKIQQISTGCQFFLPIASTISREMLQAIVKEYTVKVHFVSDHIYDLMQIADVAVAASGTVTLEAAILGLPSVVIYKMSPLTYWIGRRLVKLPDVSLPNIVAGKRVIPELLQSEVNADNIAKETLFLLKEGPAIAVRDKLREIRERLGSGGAVERVAQLVLHTAKARQAEI